MTDQQLQGQRAFATLKGKNFMTPRALDFGMLGPYAWELSKGDGLEREPIWGVSLLEFHDGHWERPAEPPQGDLFWSLTEARAYLVGLAILLQIEPPSSLPDDWQPPVELVERVKRAYLEGEAS